jgi:hypothetical protein
VFVPLVALVKSRNSFARLSVTLGRLDKLKREAERGRRLQKLSCFVSSVGVLKELVVSGDGKGREKFRFAEVGNKTSASSS